MGREIREDRWRDLAHDRGGSYADRGEGISSKVSFEGGREGGGEVELCSYFLLSQDRLIRSIIERNAIAFKRVIILVLRAFFNRNNSIGRRLEKRIERE